MKDENNNVIYCQQVVYLTGRDSLSNEPMVIGERACKNRAKYLVRDRLFCKLHRDMFLSSMSED